MFLYHKTLLHSSVSTKAISGSFTAPKKTELLLLKGSTLELLTVDNLTHKLTTLIRQDTFSHLKNISVFRFGGNKKDFIVVTADSGKITVLEANIELRSFIKLQQETFGKSGSNRIVPGDYIACDPKGRSIMIAAVEKQKFVYNFTINAELLKMSISSPHEAHKAKSICFDLIAIDNGHNNPLYASLEMDYGENEDSELETPTSFTKVIALYEMDLGLNHVIRKNAFEVDSTASKLIPVSFTEKSSNYESTLVAILVCCEGFVYVKNLSKILTQLNSDSKNSVIDDSTKAIAIPVRNESINKRPIITDYSNTRLENKLLFLIQTDLGDIFRLTIDHVEDSIIGISLEYFDTITTCLSFCVLKNGFLFGASESTHK